ncbi:hypothetical protein [Maribacter sp. 2-571]|uniref:hypothetical protein n=1 Tax=Maribacter sp. 2-571 TaxID=3417569 RepID=UPI003D354F3F
MVILFALCSLGAIMAQEGSPAALLPGNWSVDYARTKQNMHSEGRNYLDEMPQERRDRQETSYAQRQYHFTANGAFAISLQSGQTVNGEWTFLADGNMLELTLGNGQRQQYRLLYVDTTTLGLEIDVPDQGKLLYPELHLVKQN